MATVVRYTEEFEEWWQELDEAAQDDVAAVVQALGEQGAQLGMPYSKKLTLEKKYRVTKVGKEVHGVSLHELRVQSLGRPLRVLYAFDERNNAPLLIGGDKTGLTAKRFYARYIPAAYRIYRGYLEETRDGYDE